MPYRTVPYGSADDYLAAMVKVEPILEEAAAAAADAAAAEAAKVGQGRGDGVVQAKGPEGCLGEMVVCGAAYSTPVQCETAAQRRTGYHGDTVGEGMLVSGRPRRCCWRRPR